MVKDIVFIVQSGTILQSCKSLSCPNPCCDYVSLSFFQDVTAMFPSVFLLLSPQGKETRERFTIQCASEDSLTVPLSLALEEVISRTSPL
jgi:hypothetical protein